MASSYENNQKQLKVFDTGTLPQVPIKPIIAMELLRSYLMGVILSTTNHFYGERLSSMIDKGSYMNLQEVPSPHNSSLLNKLQMLQNRRDVDVEGW